MANDKISVTNAETGETIERPMTDSEQAARNALLTEAVAEAAKIPTPAEKLFNATGLTVEEYKALGL